MSRTIFRYQPDTRRDEPVIMALTVAAKRYPAPLALTQCGTRKMAALRH
ncbi:MULTISPECIES: hypothetical protein [Escherichia]|nr:hypothetical protein [Escherichia sp. HH41S]EKP4643131.1 hypothetical protein [Escherichia coli]MEB6630475.1 hypothetical protein [Escherichia coli]HAV8854175.1 hypothetical protein [Escherichia coli]HAW2942109.1 hypothetical protein [Escherichia coli]HAW3089172.1 hypothetical protein [Escherichia coli]